ncbi:MAG TPA: septum formation initiator family protein [Candidatus Limousia pullorum]|uniref:Septum formation initiator family protein n=1 Tax=Candidatus Limousia pullorum TaxID=2840860 RepID=A0A9D1LZ96_9FIRM|nr:septum formation initiator family protein [Candidatus Limousia pullorum]
MAVKNRTKTTADKNDNLSGTVKESSASKTYGKPELKEIKKPEKKKINKIGLTIKLALVVFAVYAVVTLLNQHIEILEKHQTLSDLETDIMVQEIKIEEIQNVKNYSDEENAEYMEQIARTELDYVKNGERVFVNVTGS